MIRQFARIERVNKLACSRPLIKNGGNPSQLYIPVLAERRLSGWRNCKILAISGNPRISSMAFYLDLAFRRTMLKSARGTICDHPLGRFGPRIQTPYSSGPVSSPHYDADPASGGAVKVSPFQGRTRKSISSPGDSNRTRNPNVSYRSKTLHAHPVSRRVFTGILSCTFVLTASVALADAPDADPAVEAELFSAIEAGKIDVKFIPLNTTKANVLVRNLTDQPMTLQLPARFAGVPVARQFGGGGMGGGMGGMGGGMGGGGMGGGGGGGQAMGGGMGGGGMGGGGMGGGGMGGGGMGGFMRIAPQRQQKVAVTTVCLEHGRPDPTPKMAYKIVPLDIVTKDERVHVLCEALGNRQVAQNTAQAAAWNLMDNLSWEKLAMKNRIESKYTGTVRWFSPIELQSAIAVVREATRIAESRNESEPSLSQPEESLSGDS